MSGTITFARNKRIKQSVYIPLKDIYIGDNMQTIDFDTRRIHELSLKVNESGIRMPIVVKVTDKGYEVVDGSDIYYAAKLNGISKIPCIILSDESFSHELINQVAMLQNQNLDFFQEAEAIEKLISLYGMTQEDAAACLGKAQSTIANKLRLLRLTPEERKLIIDNHLTERHARSLLRLAASQERIFILNHVIEHNLNVEKTEQAVEKVIGTKRKREPYRKRSRHSQSVKSFMDLVSRAADSLISAGIPVRTERYNSDGHIEIRIHLPHNGIKHEPTNESRIFADNYCQNKLEQ